MTDLGIVVPAYRPDPDLLAGYVESLASRFDARIRVELDDPESGVALEPGDLPAVVNRVTRRRGKGRAVADGFDALDAPVLAFADADGSTPADSLADVVAPVASDEVGLAVGSRRHPDAAVRCHQKPLRRRFGDAYAWVARRVLDVRLWDYQCGAKAIRSEDWSRLREHLVQPGFAWDTELVATADALGVSIREVPITWVDRPASTVSPVGGTLALGCGLVRAGWRARGLSGRGTAAAAGRGRSPVDRDVARPRPDDD